MTAFALIHGAYGRGAGFAPLVAALERRGHAAVAPDLPCEDPAATFADYAAAVPAGVDVVVGHSLGGVTAALVAAQRGIPVVYVAAILPRPGRPLREVLPDAVLPAVPAAEERAGRGLRRLPQSAADELLHPGADLRAQAVAPYFEPCPLDRVPAGPYVVCARDRVVSPAYGRAAAPDGVVELDAGHCPYVECPDALAEVLAG